MRPQLLFLLVFVLGLSGAVQAQLNSYKYIIVPKKFNGYKQENKYQTSTAVKHLFTQKGFHTVYDDQLPEELSNNRCLGLLTDLIDNSTMFSTKVNIVLKDCQGIEVFRTMEGKSKIKNYNGAYRAAIRDAFTIIQSMDYAYVPQKEIVKDKVEEPITISFKNDVKTLDAAPAAPAPKVIEQVATPETQTFKSIEPEPSDYKQVEKTEAPAVALLYAQPTENGYQLVDSTPKVVLKLIKTSVDNIFLVDDETKNGMVYKKGDKWFLEYAAGSGKKQEELNIKF